MFIRSVCVSVFVCLSACGFLMLYFCLFVWYVFVCLCMFYLCSSMQNLLISIICIKYLKKRILHLFIRVMLYLLNRAHSVVNTHIQQQDQYQQLNNQQQQRDTREPHRHHIVNIIITNIHFIDQQA